MKKILKRDSLALIPTLFLLFLAGSGCKGDETIVSNGEGEEPELPVLEAVAADGRLETVTWNLEWYGHESFGPGNEDLQTKNILLVLDSLKADLYAFQEVYDQAALNRLTRQMEGYRGFVAPHIDWVQKTAFVYNTATIDSISTGGITEEQSSYDWANGRFPLYFEFDYHYQGNKIRIYAVAIHAKATTEDTWSGRVESYERRKRAAESLYHFLTDNKPETNILFLGDFNDDVDAATLDGASVSPYHDFVLDETNFQVVTKSLSERGESSYVPGGFTDLIDHIVIGKGLFGLYITESEEIFTAPLNFIDRYANTTSDHLPVWSKFDMSGHISPEYIPN